MQSLVDENGYDAIQAEAQLAKDAVEAGEWELATDYWASTEWVVIDKTHGVDFYNILKFVDYWSKQLTSSQEQDQEVKHGLALHAKKRRLYLLSVRLSVCPSRCTQTLTSCSLYRSGTEHKTFPARESLANHGAMTGAFGAATGQDDC